MNCVEDKNFLGTKERALSLIFRADVTVVTTALEMEEEVPSILFLGLDDVRGASFRLVGVIDLARVAFLFWVDASFGSEE